MEKLPNEILEKIIGFIDKKDLLLVRLVNKTWQSYAEDYLRKTMTYPLYGENILDLIKVTSWRNLEKTIPPFVRFYIYPDLTDNEIIEEFASKYGKVIQSLRFIKHHRWQHHPKQYDAPKMYKSILKLLMEAPNIQEIQFYHKIRPFKFKNDKLYLPNVRVLEFGHIDPKLVKLLLNASPNVQQVKFGQRPNGDLPWKDYITILQSIASRGIEVGLELRIWVYPGFVIDLHKFKQLLEIQLTVSELTLHFQTGYIATEDVHLLKEAIEAFIYKNSRSLKYLNISCSLPKEENENNGLTFNLKNLDCLEKLELDGEGSTATLKVNLGLVPLLKETSIKIAVLNYGSAPSLRILSINSDNVPEYLYRPILIDAAARPEKLCLKFSNNTITTTATDERVKSLNNCLLSQAKNLRELKIEAQNSTGLDKLQFPKMENLRRLTFELRKMEKSEKLKLQQSSFPSLQFLCLNTPLYPNPSSNESMENVHTLIIKSDSLIDLKNAGLKFPKLRKLHITGYSDDNTGVLHFVFKSMKSVEDLFIDSMTTWNEFTGNSKFVDFLGEASTRILKTSVPNLGDLTALHSLVIGRCTKLSNLKAIPYLISCWKLTKLKYFEAIVSAKDMKLISPVVKIMESNNTKVKILDENDLHGILAAQKRVQNTMTD